MTIAVDYIPDTAKHSDYYPGQNICLNCPLPLKHLAQSGKMVETCNQANSNAIHKYEPKCPLAQARYYHVSLEEAEKIAEAVSLHPQRKITADRYRFELMLRSKRTAINANNHIKPITQNGRAVDLSRECPNGKATVRG